MNFQAGINSGNEGLYWLNQIKKSNPDISVVLITAYSDVELAVKALKQGATDFIPKPWENSKLLATAKSAIQLNFSKQEVGKLKAERKRIKTRNKSRPKIYYWYFATINAGDEHGAESGKNQC